MPADDVYYVGQTYILIEHPNGIQALMIRNDEPWWGYRSIISESIEKGNWEVVYAESLVSSGT